MDTPTCLVGEGVNRNTECASKAEIAQLQLAFPVDEKVLRFEVSVQNPVLVTERSALEKLVHKTPNGDGIEGATLAVDIHVLLEVAFTVLKYEDELCLGVDDVVEADDIDMLELFHEGDLTDGG